MPITVKDYTWDETESTVHVVIPLKGVKPSKVDIFATDEYLKVSYPPYLFEAVLLRPVDDAKNSAQIGSGTVTLALVKKEQGIWNRLQSLDTDKEILKSKRQTAIDVSHKRANEEKQRVAAEKQERDRTALREQMRLEEEKRKRIEDVKEAARQTATEDIEKWKMETMDATEGVQNREDLGSDKNHDDGSSDVDIFYSEEESSHTAAKPQVEVRCSSPGQSVPPPRSSGTIQVSFTPRVFPTPLRESKVEAEEEWLRKQAESRRVVDIDDPDLTEEEKNPVWLKDKGDRFCKSGNLLAAVNAYNLAVRLDSKIPAVYSNRATCHLKLRNFIKCIEDCSKALELLTPPVESNARSRLRAHVKRGTAFCELELYIEGLQDYEAALKLDPKNEQLQLDTAKIRTVIQSSVG